MPATRRKRTLRDPLESFWSKVERGPDCWLWTNAPSSSGYGHFQYGGRARMAHRYAYEQEVGLIPDGLVLHHTCGNFLCVNPAHLEPMTRRESYLLSDGYTARLARENRCKRGHPFNKANTRITTEGKRRCRVCERERQRRETPERKSARQLVRRALDRGDLVRPDACENCGREAGEGRSGLITAHHSDYSRPLDVTWLCWSCHLAHHRPALANFRKSQGERDDPLARPGMVTVYGSQGEYLGCMGRERWERLLADDNARESQGDGG